MDPDRSWRRCNACKDSIALGATYWVCSVSTCNRKRTGMAFCSVDCWEVHLPVANHREAWAVEKTAPHEKEPQESATERTPRRRVVRSDDPGSSGGGADPVLIVASRLKDFVRARSGMNTSDGVLDPLSDIVRRVCDEAIENARRDGRKTVLDRDIPSS